MAISVTGALNAAAGWMGSNITWSEMSFSLSPLSRAWLTIYSKNGLWPSLLRKATRFSALSQSLINYELNPKMKTNCFTRNPVFDT